MLHPCNSGVPPDARAIPLLAAGDLASWQQAIPLLSAGDLASFMPMVKGGRLAILLTMLRHPRLWRIALTQVVALRRSRWWLRPPFLPLPDPKYLQFRSQTAYGGDGTTILHPDDVVVWLRWCKTQRQMQ